MDGSVRRAANVDSVPSAWRLCDRPKYGPVAYQLAVVVDDHDSDVNFVVRETI